MIGEMSRIYLQVKKSILFLQNFKNYGSGSVNRNVFLNAGFMPNVDVNVKFGISLHCEIIEALTHNFRCLVTILQAMYSCVVILISWLLKQDNRKVAISLPAARYSCLLHNH